MSTSEIENIIIEKFEKFMAESGIKTFYARSLSDRIAVGDTGLYFKHNDTLIFSTIILKYDKSKDNDAYITKGRESCIHAIFNIKSDITEYELIEFLKSNFVDWRLGGC